MTEATLEPEHDVISSALSQIFAEGEGCDVSAQIEEFGMAEFLTSSPQTAIPLIFSLQGEFRASSRALYEVCLQELRHVLNSATSPRSILLPRHHTSGDSAGKQEFGRVRVSGIIMGVPDQDVLLAVEAEDGTSELCVISLGQSNIRMAGVSGIDQRLSLTRVDGTCEATARIDGVTAHSSWFRAVTMGRIALSYELLGVARSSLRLATQHVLSRQQFGRAIGTFQAVKHRLADVLIAIEAAQAAADAALQSRDRLAAMVAKSMSGKAARTAAAHCGQVLGGIGFTWEHPLHQFYKRGLVLDHLFGSADELPEEIGQAVRAAGNVPRLVEL
jgi:hypothetical protein